MRELRFHKFRWMAECPLEILSWPRSACCYLPGDIHPDRPYAHYNLTYLTARRTLVPLIKLWAYDHLCLYARSLPLPSESRSHR